MLITGCSSGFGQAAARLFASRGFRVFASLRTPSAGAPLREEATANGWSLTTPRLDVTDDDSVRAAVEEVLAATGGTLDVLVNNAGYFCVGPVEETHPDELQAQLETNVLGALRLCRAVLPAMHAQGQGRIVNVSSLAALSVIPMLGPYHASKAALEALGEALHYELAPFGIRVASILPGPFPTALQKNQVRVGGGRASSRYLALAERFERLNAQAPQGDVNVVVRAIFFAATCRRPRLRYFVGPLSFVSRYLHPITPQWLYGWVVRRVFGLRSGPPAGSPPPASPP